MHLTLQQMLFVEAIGVWVDKLQVNQVRNARFFSLIADECEVFEMTTTSAAKTIATLRHLFSTYGLPEQVVSDNGPQFTSEEFQQFMQSNRVKHIRCAPYHPASNGAVESFNQTFKRALKASEKDGRSLSHRLADFLLTYRSTPHSTTNRTPSSLFLNRELRTRFSLLHLM